MKASARFGPTSLWLARLLSCAFFTLPMAGSTGLDPTFQSRFELPGTVTELAVQADGKVLVGGTFDRAGPSPAAGLVRLTPEGQLDPSFTPSIGGIITALAIQPTDGKILVAGQFPGQSSKLVRLNQDGSRDPSFLTNVWAEYRINALMVHPNGMILVGGQFG